jgi:4'-phosphopantetheinyl transferase
MDGVTSHRVIRFERPRMRVDVIEAPVDAGRMLERWMAQGSALRRAKAGRYYFVADAIRCLASEALLRYALREECQIDLDAATVAETELGKPYLADHPGVQFNLSRSGEWIACAMAEEPVGGDVEVVRPISDLPAAQFMSGVEHERFLALDPDARVGDFYRLWTVKKSVLKALGTGFSVDPRLVTLMHVNGRVRIETIPAPYDRSCWDVRALDMPDGVHAAVCVASRNQCGE